MTPREQEIRVTFYSDDETARLIKDHMEVAAMALTVPTKETASALFTIGAEAVVNAAHRERKREEAAA